MAWTDIKNVPTGIWRGIQYLSPIVRERELETTVNFIITPVRAAMSESRHGDRQRCGDVSLACHQQQCKMVKLVSKIMWSFSRILNKLPDDLASPLMGVCSNDFTPSRPGRNTYTIVST